MKEGEQGLIRNVGQTIMKDFRNKLYTLATALGLFSVATAAIALLMSMTVPCRIGPEDYLRYNWSSRCESLSGCIMCATLILGLISFRGWRPLVLAVSAFVLLARIDVFHSGPMPEWWCCLNLNRIEDAKEQLISQYNLTNGTMVTRTDLMPFIENGERSLKCAVGGAYSINPVGVEPLCSIHGSISEMDTKCGIGRTR